MVSDASAAKTDAKHSAALVSFYRVFGDVMDTNFLIRCLERDASIDPLGATLYAAYR